MRIILLVLSALLLRAQAQTAPRDIPPAPPRVRMLDPLARMVNDYGDTARYAAEDEKVLPPSAGEDRVVFMGDSITDFWGRGVGVFFPGKPYINRGISGQVTPQMLLRFYQDVVALKPKVVVILAGTNDIGGNVGPMTLEATEDYLMSMVDIARANNIRIVLSSLLPVCDYIKPQTAQRPPEKILALNRWLKDYAGKNRFVYLDYFSATVDDKGMLRKDLTNDGLHPNAAGYEVMTPLAEKAIAKALAR
ncbi:MAG: SGNH/GDSL hydrolase family protein [Bryobacteraceae bacterium]|jgi:lysophospholipase L1-like esterase